MSETPPPKAGEKQFTVRADAALVAALDREAARLRAVAPGVKVTRADCVRSLLLGALSTPAAALSSPVAGSCR